MKAPWPSDRHLISFFLILAGLTLAVALFFRWAILSPVSPADWIEMATK